MGERGGWRRVEGGGVGVEELKVRGWWRRANREGGAGGSGMVRLSWTVLGLSYVGS